ncbi:hypothetical protein HELRODRAFT_168530 [Helobdella robusta]|uniref:Uncharacterized protein n=1 Tax=Helobdella robusta TaxID=6412 RepID=T1F0P2_HELRO|nr:hypothetical protein HELRODRAFT_168530 [Helobdella robusta]ESO09533.1 hypothetical protein HELRODRAFT_168530 [Helobdella robusta]
MGERVVRGEMGVHSASLDLITPVQPNVDSHTNTKTPYSVKSHTDATNLAEGGTDDPMATGPTSILKKTGHEPGSDFEGGITEGRAHHGGLSAGPGGMGDWNMTSRRFNKLDLTGGYGKHATNRSLFIFNEGNFIRKSAQTIIEWGYPFLCS